MLVKQIGRKMSDIAIVAGPNSNFSLSAGVSSVLSQLLPSCSSEKQFRALNLDITCPPSLPTVTACHCLTKNQQGQLLSKISGQIDYKVKYCRIVYHHTIYHQYVTTTDWKLNL